MYCVQIQNALGSTSACARLSVIPKPNLVISEVMGLSADACPSHHDWFEVANLGTNAVNIRGYRFSDNFGLDGAQTNTNSAVMAPGEVVVFAKRMTPEVFTQWWGRDNLPPGLKIIPYDGFSLGGQTPELNLWNAAAEDVNDYIDTKSWPVDTLGASVYFDCLSDPVGFSCLFGALSDVAQAGAFRAVECGDIGSPGYIANPAPRFVTITRLAAETTLKWRAVEGRSYALSFCDALNAQAWNLLNTYVATNSVQTATDSTTGAAGQRFYRLQELP